MLQEAIRDYWNVRPPFKAGIECEEGTQEWSQSILDHRYKLFPYCRTWIDHDLYSGKRVLDLGCGAGSDLLELARAGARVTGIDIAGKAIDISKKRLEVEGLPHSLLIYDGRVLPFEDCVFDLVVSNGMLHHTPFMDDLINEVYRVLLPGREFKFMVYHKDSLLYYYSILYLKRHLKNLYHWSQEEVLSFYSEFREGCKYTRCYTENEIKDKLWFFRSVNVEIRGLLYDSFDKRKKIPEGPFSVKIGVPDIDAFFEKYNASYNAGENMERYGWFLYVTAIK